MIEPVTRLVQGQVLLILSGGQTQFARFLGKALITEDGEAIEGDAAEDVEVMGRVTYFINSAIEDGRGCETNVGHAWLFWLCRVFTSFGIMERVSAGVMR